MTTDPKKRGLGRGLAALIADTSGAPGVQTGPQTSAPAPPAQPDTTDGAPRLVPLDALAPNPHQPRGQFDEESLGELAASIRVHGIIQPIVATPAPEAGRFWIIAGERRWRAAQLAGLETAPVLLRDATAQALTELALVENVQRTDLNAVEEARAYQSLLDDYGLTQAEVAARVGKSRSAVANTVRLLDLPPEAQEAVVAGRIAAGHARALLPLPDAASVLLLLDEIERRGLSVRQTEALVKEWLETQAAAQAAEPPAEPPAAPPAKPQLDPQLLAHLGDLEDRFRSALGTKVSLDRKDNGSGRLVVHFYSDEDLDAIYRLITGDSGVTR